MEINPQRVRTAEFSTSRKGLDQAEVREFLNKVANELERAQNQATAMEARARAAVARLQQLTDDGDVSGEVASPAPVGISTNVADEHEAAHSPTDAEPVVDAAAATAPIAASVDESETISRTMLLAQRAADMTIAEAEAEAARLRTEADDAAAALVEQAKSEARSAGESERAVIEGEVNALIARRDFLESDVDHMEQFLVDQRMRLREAATAMIDVAERVPGGLGEVRRPLLSASDDTDTGHDVADADADAENGDGDEPQDATMAYERPTGDDAAESADDIDDGSAVGDVDAVAPPVMRLGFDDN